MRLKNEIIERIRGNEDAKPALMQALKKNRQQINRLVRLNANNGELTKLCSLVAICNVLEVEDPKELLTHESKVVKSKHLA